MKGSIAEDLYSEIDDESLWDGCSEELDKASDLDREWQRRRDQFHSIGYRDGVIAGKEASAQAGFNVGFNESVLVGYKLGIVRGVSSALACLSDGGVIEKLVGAQEKREEFQCLYESVHSLSTTEGLRLFLDDIVRNKTLEQSDNVETSSSHVAGLQDYNSVFCSSLLGKYFGELQSLLHEAPAIDVHFLSDQ